MVSDGGEEHQTEAGLLVKFSESTSMHGLNRAVGSTQLWKRVVWKLLVLGGMAIAVYNLSITFRAFVNYPTSTKVTLEYQSNAPFPAVTICNLNRVQTGVSQSIDMKVEEWQMNESSTVEEQARKLSLQLKLESFESLEKWGHSLKDMLINCHFNQERCYEDDFTFMPNQKYGNCYIFNFPFNSKHGRMTRRPGSENGLQLELDINQDSYMHTTAATGMKVVIHDRDAMPFPEDDGLVVGPGMATSIGVKRVEIHREPPPYTQCVESNSQKANEWDAYSYLYNFTYSIRACRKTCIQSTMYQMCDCCDESYPCVQDILHKMAGETLKKKGQIPYCIERILNESTDLTKNCQLQTNKDDKNGCQCQLPCDETLYTLTVTQGVWPSRAYAPYFIKKINRSAIANNKSFEYLSEFHLNLNKVKENFVKLDVFYEQLNYERIESVPTFDWNSLLGEVGGQLGLWLGFSVLTAVEFIELFFDFAKDAVCCVSPY